MSLPDRLVLVIGQTRGQGKNNDSYAQLLQHDATVSYHVVEKTYDVQIPVVCQSQQFDGILLEAHLPSIDSLELLSRFQLQLGKVCPPVVMIGSENIQAAVAALKAGAADYLVKDQLTPDALCLSLRTAIENAELKRALEQSHEQFQTSVENMMDCFGIFTAMRDEAGHIIDFRIDYLNTAACQNNQLPREAQIGRGLCEVLPGHRESELFNEYCQIVETGQPLIKESLIYDDLYSGQRLIRAFDIRATKLNDGFVASWRDITDRKQLELELSRTAANLQQQQVLAEAMPLMVWTADANGAVKYWNQCWYDYTGLSEAESMGMAGASVVHPADRDRTLQQWSQSLTDGTTFEIEHRLCRWDGVYHWFINRGTPTRNDQGQIIGWIGTITDIDQQKRLAERFRLAMGAVNGLVYDWNLETNEIYRSEKLFDLIGIAPEAAPPNETWWYDQIHPEDRPHIQQQAQELLTNTDRLFESEYRIRHHNGHWVTVWDRGRIIRNQEGQIVRVVGSTVDVSDRKQAELALQQSQERLNLAMKAAKMGSWDWDIQTGQVNWSANLEHLFGMAPGSFNGRYMTVMAMIHPEDRARVQQAIHRAVHEREDYKIEFRFIKPDGSVRWAVGLGQVFYDDAGNPIRMTGVDMDISERKQQEVEKEQLLQREYAARQDAERANRIKDEFLAILSHELRSPLNPILGWAKLLQTKQFDADITARALSTIERNARLQTQLVDDLLDVGRILRGKLTLKIAPVDPAFVITAAIETVQTLADAKDITIQTYLSETGQVRGDTARLQQIVWNLLTNAIKFTPENGQVAAYLTQVEDQVQIVVTDTGIGIHSDFLPHIFDSFRQENTSVTRQFGGLGLGLAIVHYLVKAHNGTIAADSPGEGQGAIFTVNLPLWQTEQNHPQPVRSSPHDIDLTGIRVMVVDDSPDSLGLLKALLEQYGATVATFDSATEILENIASYQPDVLISDIGMPDVDGYTLIRQIRALPTEQGGQTPAIAFTAYVRAEDQQRALDNGFQKHLAKPIQPDLLILTVAELALQ